MSHPVELDQYDAFLREVKQRIATARVRAALAVNAELVALYWQIGRLILERQERHGWGGKVIDRLAVDLRTAFPETKGFSRSNLHYARKVAAWYPESGFVQQPVGQIPWGHLVLLLDKAGDAETALWYAQKTLEHGWSRNVLAHQSALTEQIQRFLLELGRGFAFVGRQHRLVVGGDEFFIDLLFYHLSLRCFIVVELKTREFTPEDLGKVAFYRAAIDGELRHPDDQPTIGLVLCASRNETVVEYALHDLAAPVAVSEYVHALPTPDELRTAIDEGRRAYLEATS